MKAMTAGAALALTVALVACGGSGGATPEKPRDVRSSDGFLFGPQDTGGPGPNADTSPGETSSVDGTASPDTDVACGADGTGCPCDGDEACAALDDANPCNGALVCREGRCAVDPASVPDCAGESTACAVARCDPTTGACAPDPATFAPDGTDCSDGDSCTGGDACEAGVCVPGTEDLCGVCKEPIVQLLCNSSQEVSTNGEGEASSYSCDTAFFPGPELVYKLGTTSPQQVVARINNPELRLFLIDGAGPCAPSACLATDPQEVVHLLEGGQKVYVVVDGPRAAATGLRVDCYEQGPELCADGRDNDWDGLADCDDEDCHADLRCTCGDDNCDRAREDCESCAADCGACVCGDGTCNETESCTSCPIDCGECPECGDGACEEGENCATCEADCGGCTALPCADEEIVCGGAASLETLSGEDNTIEDYGVCGAIDGGNGKDRVYRFVSAERQTVTVSLSIRQNGEEKCNNYDLYVLEEACSGTACLHRSGNANLFDCNERITFQTRPGTVYLFVVEPPVFAGTESGFDLTVSCE